MTEPVGCWNGDIENVSSIKRSALGPVATFSDAELDALYARLVAIEEGGNGQQDAETTLLLKQIRDAEEKRAEEMSAFFANTGATLDPEGLRQLLTKVDKVFGT